MSKDDIKYGEHKWIAPSFISNGLGQPMCTDWQPMDAPVGPTMLAAGPSGWIEIGDDGWRMWRPFDWNVGG
jgi:hypothetical protein